MLGTAKGQLIRVGTNNIKGHKDQMGMTYGWNND
jgi:hypothetical protein